MLDVIGVFGGSLFSAMHDSFMTKQPQFVVWCMYLSYDWVEIVCIACLLRKGRKKRKGKEYFSYAWSLLLFIV